MHGFWSFTRHWYLEIDNWHTLPTFDTGLLFCCLMPPVSKSLQEGSIDESKTPGDSLNDTSIAPHTHKHAHNKREQRSLESIPGEQGSKGV